MAKKKFTEGDNPALQFISNTQEEKTDVQADNTTDIPVGYKLVPETKTKRVNLVFRPSLYDQANEFGKKEKISLNELVHLALEDYMK